MKSYREVKLVILAIGLLFSSLTFGKSMTLHDALKFALEHNPDFDSAVRGRTVADLKEKVTYSGFFPSLDFNTTDGLQLTHPIGLFDPYATALNISMTENLYDNGQTLTNYKISKDNYKISELNTLKARDQLCLNVAAAFYQYSLTVKLLELKKEQLVTLDKQLSLVNSQYQQGFKTKKDFLRLKSQVQLAQIDILSSRNDIETAVNELKRLLGMGAQSHTPDPLEFEPMEPDREQPELGPTTIVPEEFYDFKIARFQSEANEFSVDLVRRNYWPQFNFVIASFYSNSGIYGPVTEATTPPGSVFAPLNAPPGPTNYNAESYGASALVTVSYNIWDWGIRKNNIEIAESSKIIQDDSLTSGLLTLRSNIKNAETQLYILIESFKIQKELLQSETQSYEILKIDYREGKIPYLDMITSLTSLLDAKVTYFTTYFTLLSDVARHHYYEGNLYEKIYRQ